MSDVRTAQPHDIPLATAIAADAFSDDPLMTWVFPDVATRRAHLSLMFRGLVEDVVLGGGVLHLLDDACTAIWRTPSFEHGRTAADRVRGAGDGGAPSLPEDALARLDVLGTAMMAAHPHDPHWYLNVVGTLASHRGGGLGRQVLGPVLDGCDAEGVPAYLESSNPRNLGFYRRLGFEQTGEVRLPDGPSLYPMWREPGASGPRR